MAPKSTLCSAIALAVVALAAVGSACNVDYVCFAIDRTVGATVLDDNTDMAEEMVNEFESQSPSPTQYSAVEFDSSSSSGLGKSPPQTIATFIGNLQSPTSAAGSDNLAEGLAACKNQLLGLSGTCLIVVLSNFVNYDAAAIAEKNDIVSRGIFIATAGVGNAIVESNANALASPTNEFVKAEPQNIPQSVNSWVKPRACKLEGSGAHGDPHLTGFDGSKFDFHGEDKQKYALFGRQGGDLVVGTIHAVDNVEHGRVVANKPTLTYFREFGVTPAGSKALVRVAMTKCPRTGEWQLGTELNGMAIIKSAEADGVQVARLTDEKVTVATSEGRYIIRMMWAKDVRKAHLNVQVDLLRAPIKSDSFAGVLGITLNKRLGRKKDADYADALDEAVREKRLVSRFHVSGLFPKWNNGGRHGQKMVRPEVRISSRAEE